jgi:hypothetical protein
VKLEFLPDGHPPLIRLYNFTRKDACHLVEILDSLANGTTDTVALERDIGIEAVGGCQLTLSVGTRDWGVRAKNSVAFEGVLTRHAWEEVARLADLFCSSESSGFQWLTGKGAALLLLSRDGRW